jgi:phage head maturation protease
METLRDLDIVRALPPQAKPTLIRDADPDAATEGPELGRLVVRFSPFETWYPISSYFEGDFMERTVRGAFGKTMREQGTNVKVQFDHGYDTAVGSRVLALAEELREDADSAVLEGDLFDTQYNRDLLPGLKRRRLRLLVPLPGRQGRVERRARPSADNPRGLPERTITEVRLYEAGPVVFPANPEATTGVRSMTDVFWERARQRDPQVEGLLARARSLRAPERTSPDAAAGTTTEARDEAARTTDTEPAEATRGGYTPRQRRALIHPTLSRKDTP